MLTVTYWLTLIPRPVNVCGTVPISQNQDHQFSIYRRRKQLSRTLQMQEKELHTLELFTSLKPQDQHAYLEHCHSDFLRFICECIANILLGNVPIDKTLLYKFHPELFHLRKKSLSTTVRRKILSSKRGVELLNIIAVPILKKLKKWAQKSLYLFRKTCIYHNGHR